MNKLLVVIDMQNDFIDGVLGSPEAQAIVPKVVERVEQAIKKGERIVFTKDTHRDSVIIFLIHIHHYYSSHFV